ncbi:CapA family protein [Blautia sp. MSJ-36]|uniref:CapA family protein n=1 Tax=Blautia sp. MSJ-36 TaxID=2841530 RepID=UPI001C0F8037|nr:CapA family protein [Blautia sp. MSJ-36]MBU5447973.1 CapA family protein [Blautia sp. MSJ-36]
MANDNRKPPHRHDPELARKEALKAKQARTHRSDPKESGHRQSTSRVNKRPSTHSSASSRRKTIKKNSRYQQVRRQKMMLTGGGILLLLLVIIFSARACISSRKAAEAAALQKAQEEAAAKKAEEAAKAAEKDPVSLTISVVGDCTLGTDETFDYDTSLNAYYDNNGKDYFFQNVKSIFAADDLTIANFEGTLTDSNAREDKTFAFKAPAEYAQILTSGSIEAVNTANNHSHDYGDQSYTDTLTALDNEGITHFGYDDTAVMDIKGVKVGLVGIYELNDHLGREQQLKDNIAKVKTDGAELVIVIFHWGNETETVPDTNQMTLGRLAIDEGADLVCGHHPHVLQGIETYKGKNIVYSLGNFCFGGNSSPSDMDTMIFQQTFTITSDGVQADNVTNIIPCSISSADGYNNYQPTPATGDEAARIKAKIDERSAAIPSADSTAKSSGDTGSSDTVSADEASGNTDTSDESNTSSDFSDESDSSDYDASDEEDYSSDEEADFSDNSEE